MKLGDKIGKAKETGIENWELKLRIEN